MPWSYADIKIFSRVACKVSYVNEKGSHSPFLFGYKGSVAQEIVLVLSDPMATESEGDTDNRPGDFERVLSVLYHREHDSREVQTFFQHQFSQAR